jgi:hypothetical protein
VNAVSPGPVWTPLIPATMPVRRWSPSARSRRPRAPPSPSSSRRRTSSREPGSSYINGESIRVTAGCRWSSAQRRLLTPSIVEVLRRSASPPGARRTAGHPSRRSIPGGVPVAPLDDGGLRKVPS